SPDVIEKSRFLYEGANVTFDQKSVEKGLTKDAAQSVTVLAAAKTALEGVSEDEWKAAAIDAALEVLPEQLDLKKRIVFQSIRVAECGNMVSPPLGESMELLGREVCLARLDRALELCK
ncbi:MAG: glutamate--tRNA ligase, partial [Atopobium sp.]|nr:glutamate--tRNA ligase [Atopobium sp.]